MDIQEFRKDFLEDVKSTASVIGEGSVASFVKIFTDYLINAEVLSDFTPSFFTGTGKNNRKLRIDGYVFDEFDCTMNLIIADYSGEEENNVLIRSQALQTFDRLFYFIEEAYGNKLNKIIEESTPCYDLIELLRVNKNRIRKYKLILITDEFMSDRIDTLPEKSIEGLQAECQIWDIERLYRVCFSDTGKQSIEIDFTAYTKNGLPCLEANGAISDEHRSFLCIIPGQALADIYDYYGSQLLEGNVRSFLSTKEIGRAHV